MTYARIFLQKRHMQNTQKFQMVS